MATGLHSSAQTGLGRPNHVTVASIRDDVTEELCSMTKLERLKDFADTGLALAGGSLRLILSRQRKRRLSKAGAKLDELKTELDRLQQHMALQDVSWKSVNKVYRCKDPARLQKLVQQYRGQYASFRYQIMQYSLRNYLSPECVAFYKELDLFIAKCKQLEFDVIETTASLYPKQWKEAPRSAKFSSVDATPWHRIRADIETAEDTHPDEVPLFIIVPETDDA